MKHEPIARRRATNISLPEGLAEKARELNVNISRACAQGLEVAVRDADIKRYQEAHRDKFDAWNRWFEENGMPFEDIRIAPWRD